MGTFVILLQNMKYWFLMSYHAAPRRVFVPRITRCGRRHAGGGALSAYVTLAARLTDKPSAICHSNRNFRERARMIRRVRVQLSPRK